MTMYIGVDPGVTGAIALYDDYSGIVTTFDMPTHTVKVGGKNKNVLDLHELHRRCYSLSLKAPKLAAIEEVNAMPKQGVTSSFSFGFAAGATQMAIAANEIPYQLIRPSIWKKKMRVDSDKNEARRQASQLFPNFSDQWSLKKHDGRAEAALLAYYASRYIDQYTPPVTNLGDLL